MDIVGPRQITGELWKVTYFDPPPAYVAALQVCKDESMSCSFLATDSAFDRHSYRIFMIERYPLGGNDMVTVHYVQDMRDG